ncbi:CaiB/BaiF CoA-transferase family protein [Chachezhania sediminis]|uniref:CaiB/BaiF CoA-transferase family protein n=1 Tax=Chachezhania sediminis TaxID=2599291 RepID=UPI00131B985F|nr:CoA transferase [Chachezhania sediminis]
MAGALEGLRVLDLTDWRGVMTGRMLAIMGADVLQVEPAEGSDARAMPPFDDAGGSLFWAAYGAGRRSLVLDRQTEGDRVMALAAVADVVLESGVPGRATFLDTDALLAVNPGVIHSIVTPYGLTGPKAGYADSDLTLWAAGGPLKPTESQAGIPTRLSLPQAYHHAAADALCGVMVALEARRLGGRGQQVVTSAQASATQCTLSLSMAAVIGHPNYVFRAEVKSKKKKELDLSGSGARTQRSKWPVKDGLVEMHLALGPAAGRFTNNLFALMHARGACSDKFAEWDWITLPPKIENDEISEEEMEQARTEVAAFLAGMTKRETVQMALDHRLMLAPIMTAADLADSPHAAARDFFATAGMLKLPGKLALGFDEGFAPLTPAPGIGDGGAEVETRWLTSRECGPFPAATVSATVARPLEHLTVLDLSWVVAGPMIGRNMADFGARVIRVESRKKPEVARLTGPFPEGVRDLDRSGLYENCNAGKDGLTLDLGQEEAKQILCRLAGQADVLVESFAPGQMDKWGLGYDVLSAGNPGLIMLSTSLMGQSGPWSALAGFGNIGAAMSGLQVLAGREGADPVGPYGPYTDFVAPRLALPVLMAALEMRRHTGRGRQLDVSQAEAGMQFIAEAFAEYQVTGRVPVARGNRDPLAVPNQVYACAAPGDETAWVAISVTSDAMWQGLVAETGLSALADPALATREGRPAHEDGIDAQLADWCRGQKAGAVEARLQARGVAAHVAASPDDLAADPQLAVWNHFQTRPRVDGTSAHHEACRFRLSLTPADTRRAAPAYGRDTEKVLTERLGLDAAEIARLEAAGILT